MADRKRKIELEESDIEKSPKRRKACSIDMKLKIISEAKTSNISEVSRRYKIDRHCIRDWTKNEKNLTDISQNQARRMTGKHESIKKFRLHGGGRKILDENMESVLFELLFDSTQSTIISIVTF